MSQTDFIIVEALNKMKFLKANSSFFPVFLYLSFLSSCYLPPNINAPYQQTQTLQNSQGQTAPVIGQPFTGGGGNQQTAIGQPSFTGGNQQPPETTQTFRPSRFNDGRDELPEPDINRRRGSGCEAERSSHSCHQLCREMYPRDRDECLEEDPDTIDNVYEVYQALENARDLDVINLEDLETYLDISIVSLNSLIREYKRNDAEDMLIWIAEDSEVAELIRAEDDDFRILNDLLSLMSRFDSSKIDVPFTRRVNNRDTLIDYALTHGNEEALDYFIEYILMGGQDCRADNNDIACLALMCKIGRSNRERERDYYFFSRAFEDFISEIIDNRVNGTTDADSAGPEWIKGAGDGKIDDLSDLDYTWAGDTWDPENGELPLCGGL